MLRIQNWSNERMMWWEAAMILLLNDNMTLKVNDMVWWWWLCEANVSMKLRHDPRSFKCFEIQQAWANNDSQCPYRGSRLFLEHNMETVERERVSRLTQSMGQVLFSPTVEPSLRWTEWCRRMWIRMNMDPQDPADTLLANLVTMGGYHQPCAVPKCYITF